MAAGSDVSVRGMRKTDLKFKDWLRVIAVALTVLVVAVPCSGVWVIFGSGMRRWLSDPVHVKPFNIGMAILLLASVIPVLWE